MHATFSTRHLAALIVSVGTFTGVLAGCAAPSDEPGLADERVGKVSSALPMCTEDGCPSGVEPVDPFWEVAAGTCTQGSAAVQKKVTAAWNYILGGPSPLTAYPCTQSGVTGIPYMSTLRTKINSGKCVVGEPVRQTVCGVAAVVREVTCEGLTRTEQGQIGGIAAKMDQCWGLGASGLFNTEAGSAWTDHTTYGNGISMTIDPEPAMLTQSLSGSTGAAAAAYFVNTYASTRVVRWPDTWTYDYYNQAPAGTPCSKDALGAWTEVTRTIQASTTGTRRICL